MANRAERKPQALSRRTGGAVNHSTRAKSTVRPSRISSPTTAARSTSSTWAASPKALRQQLNTRFPCGWSIQAAFSAPPPSTLLTSRLRMSRSCPVTGPEANGRHNSQRLLCTLLVLELASPKSRSSPAVARPGLEPLDALARRTRPCRGLEHCTGPPHGAGRCHD